MDSDDDPDRTVTTQIVPLRLRSYRYASGPAPGPGFTTLIRVCPLPAQLGSFPPQFKLPASSESRRVTARAESGDHATQ